MYYHRRIKIYLGILILVLLGQAVYGWMEQEGQAEGNWRAELQTEIRVLQEQLAEAPVDVQTSLHRQVEMKEYLLETDRSPQRQSAWKFSLDASHLLSVATLFLVILAAESIASDFHKGTIKLYLMRPISRSRIVMGKYASLLVASVSLLLILFAVSFVSGGMLFHFGGATDAYLFFDQDGEITKRPMWQQVLYVYGLRVVTMIMVVTMSYAISAVCRSTTIASTIAVLSLFVGSMATPLLSLLDREWSKYLLFTNLDLRQYIQGSPMVEGTTVMFSLGVLFVYFIVFHLCAWFSFVKRDVYV